MLKPWGWNLNDVMQHVVWVLWPVAGMISLAVVHMFRQHWMQERRLKNRSAEETDENDNMSRPADDIKTGEASIEEKFRNGQCRDDLKEKA